MLIPLSTLLSTWNSFWLIFPLCDFFLRNLRVILMLGLFLLHFSHSLLLQLLTLNSLFKCLHILTFSEWKACHSEFFTTWSQIHVPLSVFINEQVVSPKWAGIQTDWTNGYSLFIKDCAVHPFCFVCPAFQTSLTCSHHSKYLGKFSWKWLFLPLNSSDFSQLFLVWIAIPWAFVFYFCYR